MYITAKLDHLMVKPFFNFCILLLSHPPFTCELFFY